MCFVFLYVVINLFRVLHIQQVYQATRQLTITTQSKYGMSIKVEAHHNKSRLDFFSPFSPGWLYPYRVAVKADWITWEYSPKWKCRVCSLCSCTDDFIKVLLCCVYWYRLWYSMYWRGTSKSEHIRLSLCRNRWYHVPPVSLFFDNLLYWGPCWMMIISPYSILNQTR